MTLDSEGYRVRGHDVWICVLLPGNSKLFACPWLECVTVLQQVGFGSRGSLFSCCTDENEVNTSAHQLLICVMLNSAKIHIS